MQRCWPAILSTASVRAEASAIRITPPEADSAVTISAPKSRRNRVAHSTRSRKTMRSVWSPAVRDVDAPNSIHDGAVPQNNAEDSRVHQPRVRSNDHRIVGAGCRAVTSVRVAHASQALWLARQLVTGIRALRAPRSHNPTQLAPLMSGVVERSEILGETRDRHSLSTFTL